MADYQEISDPSIPGRFLGPTGKVFLHGDGQSWSTHKNIVTGDVQEGKFHVIPMLVPGQTNVGSLLKGEKATPEMFGTAIDYARAHPEASPLPAYDSVDAALKGEQAWHDEMQGGLLPYLQKYLTRPDSDSEVQGAPPRGGFRRGGIVPGRGSVDKVPALLTPGEFVIRKPVVQQVRPLLEHLNRSGLPLDIANRAKRAARFEAANAGRGF